MIVVSPDEDQRSPRKQPGSHSLVLQYAPGIEVAQFKLTPVNALGQSRVVPLPVIAAPNPAPCTTECGALVSCCV